MMDISKMRQRLIDAGRLKTERDAQLFDALAASAPEMIALVYAAALAGVVVSEENPDAG
ncbi:MAG: hypothetical protein QNJ23_01620 [Woeseiaceae bacterium]|nr:hypothetical protein [Woeseiaceae bacterium]